MTKNNSPQKFDSLRSFTPLVTSEQAREWDVRTQELCHLTEEDLMNKAGAHIAEAIAKDFPDVMKIAVLVGPGNNGGDGLVIAKHLINLLKLNQIKPHGSLTIICPKQGATKLWQQKKSELLKASHTVWHWTDGAEFNSMKKSSWDLVIDAVFGVGFRSELEPHWKNLFFYFKKKSVVKVSVDIPSGLQGTTGIAAEGTFKANKTYTVGCPKVGMVTGDGPAYCGKIKIIDIGFSQQALMEFKPSLQYFGKSQARRLLPKKSSWKINKSHRGHLLVIAGSVGMTGAGAMVSLAGARMGAGYVTWAQWEEAETSELNLSEQNLPWLTAVLLTAKLDEKGEFLNSIKPPTAIVIGPGLGKSEQSQKLIKLIYKKYSRLPVVVDADAIHLIKDLNLKIPSSWVLTPHGGELGALMNVSSVEISNNRLQFLMQAQQQWGGIILLKGHRSIVADPLGRVTVIGSGDPALAKAGTGDVLAGLIGGLMAMGLEPITAVCLAGYIHGKAGEYFSRKWKNDFSLIATDIIQLLPSVIKSIVINT